jgi:hypothetical protein
MEELVPEGNITFCINSIGAINLEVDYYVKGVKKDEVKEFLSKVKNNVECSINLAPETAFYSVIKFKEGSIYLLHAAGVKISLSSKYTETFAATLSQNLLCVP